MERTSLVVGEHLYRLDLGVLQRFAEEKESRPYLSQVIVRALVRKMGEAEKPFDNYRRLDEFERFYSSFWLTK